MPVAAMDYFSIVREKFVSRTDFFSGLVVSF
jgi:hypothetical protein